MIHVPGEVTPTSGIYNVVDQSGTYAGRQVTSEEGDPFPPTRHGTTEHGYVLDQQAQHLRSH